MTAPQVAVCIVTHNSAPDIPGCLESIERLSYRPLEIVLVDCASRDGSLEIARRRAPPAIPVQLVGLRENAGFAGGMNAALARTRAPFVLLLNADARPAPDYVTRLVRRAEAHPGLKVGAVTGRLVRTEGGWPAPPRRLRHAPDPHLAASGPRLGRGRPRPVVRGPSGSSAPPAPPPSSGGRPSTTSPSRARSSIPASTPSARTPSSASACASAAGRCSTSPPPSPSTAGSTSPSGARAMPAMVNYHSLKNRYLLRLYHQTRAEPAAHPRPHPGPRPRRPSPGCCSASAPPSRAYAWLWRNRARAAAPAAAHPGAPDRTAGSDRPLVPRPGRAAPVSVRPLSVALIGSRGIPNRYGGYETLMEELAVRLLARGFRVTVYCRSHSTPRELTLLARGRPRGAADDPHQVPRHAGAHPALLPARGADGLRRGAGGQLGERPLRAAAAAWAASRWRCTSTASRSGAPSGGPSAGRSTPSRSASPACCPTSWSPTPRSSAATTWSATAPSPCRSPTASTRVRPAETGVLARLGLADRRYFLYVSRFEPENNPHRVAEAYRSVGGDLPLVMVGGAPYAGEFIPSFTRGADPRILFPGADLRRGLPRAALPRPGLHPRHRGGRHPPGPGGGHGVRQLRRGQRHAREPGGGGRGGPLLPGRRRRRRSPSSSRPCGAIRTGRAARGREAARRAALLFSWERVADQYAALFRAPGERPGTKLRRT